MRKAVLTLIVLAAGFGAASLIASPGASARTSVDGTLTGAVGTSGNPDAFSITLSTHSVLAGTYQLNVSDFSDMHNFHFCRIGANATTCAANTQPNVMTPLGDHGSYSFTVTLTPGTYIYYCDLHPSQMHGALTVTDGTTTTPAINVKILSILAKRKLVTVKAKASQPTTVTGVLLDKTGVTQLATKAVVGTTVTLKLKPLTKLTPGKYTVKVTTGSGATAVTRQRKITVM